MYNYIIIRLYITFIRFNNIIIRAYITVNTQCYVQWLDVSHISLFERLWKSRAHFRIKSGLSRFRIPRNLFSLHEIMMQKNIICIYRVSRFQRIFLHSLLKISELYRYFSLALIDSYHLLIYRSIFITFSYWIEKIPRVKRHQQPSYIPNTAHNLCILMFNLWAEHVIPALKIKSSDR